MSLKYISHLPAVLWRTEICSYLTNSALSELFTSLQAYLLIGLGCYLGQGLPGVLLILGFTFLWSLLVPQASLLAQGYVQ